MNFYKRDFALKRPEFSSNIYLNSGFNHSRQRKEDAINCGVICLIILEKITVFNSPSNKDSTRLYPHCLYSFITQNINKNFVFVKIHMIFSYALKFSGKDYDGLIKILEESHYNEFLILEKNWF